MRQGLWRYGDGMERTLAPCSHLVSFVVYVVMGTPQEGWACHVLCPYKGDGAERTPAPCSHLVSFVVYVVMGTPQEGWACHVL
ncbi:MAG: hypothetical protein LBL36_05635, partial [Clostridiales Family XIII bacterium]|nr:hypothetical protein [Clostridiales Family XIII bacterium]